VVKIAQVVDAKRVSVYLSMAREVQTLAILDKLFAENKRVFIPTVTGLNSHDMIMPELMSLDEFHSLEKSSWGIPEFSKAQLEGREDGLTGLESSLVDVVLAPGVVFSPSCDRIGQGKGYYDCFLEKLERKRESAALPKPFVIGLALDEQIRMQVPTSSHDMRLDAVVTPTNLFTPENANK